MFKWPVGPLLMASCLALAFESQIEAKNVTYLKQVKYGTESLFKMNMSDTKQVSMTLYLDKDSILQRNGSLDSIGIMFKTVTLAPQFDILVLDNSVVRFSNRELEASNYAPEIRLTIYADYIGRANVRPTGIEITTRRANSSKLEFETIELDSDKQDLDLRVVVVQYEGIWGKVFIISVVILIIISYINLGAQLDTKSMSELVKKPKTLILGFLITVLIMPIASWFISQCLLSDQPLYRLGAFIFACGPTATASTLWTVMLNSDKELSVGLQVASTTGALFSMPVLLYLMDVAMQHADGGAASVNHYAIRVPYARLIETLFVLMLALFIGWRFIGRHEKAQKISAKVFRPLTFFVLIFIIVFSSIVYWHIYRMFDWNITLSSMLITMSTYLATASLGYLINCSLDHAIAISISSAYKNSGIAFAVLLVAFESPDTYIAYVPCLTQVVTTSITLYLAYCLTRLVQCVRRCGQPDPIQTVPSAEEEDVAGDDQQVDVEGCCSRRNKEPTAAESNGSSDTSRGIKSQVTGENGRERRGSNEEETEGFIPMNLTDVVAGGQEQTNESKVTGEIQS